MIKDLNELRPKMKMILLPLIAIIVLLNYHEAAAQRRWQKNDPSERGRPERLDKYRKMRLVEMLNLKEEEAIRFFAKEDAHRENMRKLMNDRNGALDELDKVLQNEKEPPEIGRFFDRIRTIDRQMTAERERYQDELKAFLSPVQFGEFLIFERNFGNRLRDAFDELHRERGNKPAD